MRNLGLALLCLLAVPAAASAAGWNGTPTGVFRTATVDHGEWIYTNGLHQARGANTDGLHRTDYFKAVDPQGDDPTHINRDLYNALTYDFFGAHRSTHNGDYELPQDATKYPEGTADLAEVRLAVQGDALHVRLEWNSFPSASAQVATLTFGSPSSPLQAWPRNARLTSRWSAALTVWGTGASLADAGGEHPVTASAGDHVTEAVVPLSALPAGPWTLTGGAGLDDPAKPGQYWDVPTGLSTTTAPGSGGPASPTNVWDLLFADDAPWTFDERRQADDLESGSAATDTAVVDPADLVGHRTVTTPQRTGDIERMFTSAISEGDGIQRSGGAQVAQGQPGYGADETWHYTGRLQPYGMHVPARYPATADRAWPLIVYLHGFANYLDEPYYNPVGLTDEADKEGYLVASPLERGDYSYRDEGMVDVREVIRDVEAHYHVDRDRIYLMGHSMGGYGTNRIGMHFPDLFAAIAPAEGTDTPELHANLRNVPWYETSALEDLDVGGQQAKGLYDSLSADGYDATLTVYGMKIHEYSSIYENLPELFRFFGAHRRDSDPAVVTWTRPADDNPKLGLVFDGAYWLSGVTGAGATVTVTSDAIAHRVPDPAASQVSQEVVFDPNSPTKRSIGIRYRTTPGFQPAAPTANTLEVRTAHTSALTVDLDRARLDADRLRIVSHTDGPVTLTLHGARGDEVVDLPAGGGDLTLH